MAIPFIRKFPNGKRVAQTIARPPVIENKARAFLDRGGRYLLEVQTDGLVHLMALLDIKRDGEPGVEEVAHIACNNGPGLPAEIDKLVQQSIDNSPPPEQSKIIAFDRPELLIPANKNLELVK